MSAVVSFPAILRIASSETLESKIPVPRVADNLFECLIRDPQAPHRPARERQCAEMLRAVLVNCPTLAASILIHLAKISDTPLKLVNELDWNFETERPIGAKRDDLRIEGWRADGDETGPDVLWTIEIKVAAPFHESSPQEWNDGTIELGVDDTEIVNQLWNYDTWLAEQTSDHRAGFVLAIRDMNPTMPSGLAQTWRCLRWRDLALEVEVSLANEALPLSEQSLAEHFLGFIRHRLWDSSDMTASRLELDDVALLRALAAIGPACSRKFKELVGKFKELFHASGVSFLEIRNTSTFFDRTDIAQYSVGGKCASDLSWLTVYAGVVGDEVRVWVSCNPTEKNTKQAVRRILSAHQAELTVRNSGWKFAEPNSNDWIDGSVSKPLISVLAIVEWQLPLIDFVRSTLQDLKETGVLAELLKLDAKQNAGCPG